jgi:hypothetical protein
VDGVSICVSLATILIASTLLPDVGGRLWTVPTEVEEDPEPIVLVILVGTGKAEAGGAYSEAILRALPEGAGECCFTGRSLKLSLNDLSSFTWSSRCFLPRFAFSSILNLLNSLPR